MSVQLNALKNCDVIDMNIKKIYFADNWYPYSDEKFEEPELIIYGNLNILLNVASNAYAKEDDFKFIFFKYKQKYKVDFRFTYNLIATENSVELKLNIEKSLMYSNGKNELDIKIDFDATDSDLIYKEAFEEYEKESNRIKSEKNIPNIIRDLKTTLLGYNKRMDDYKKEANELENKINTFDEDIKKIVESEYDEKHKGQILHPNAVLMIKEKIENELRKNMNKNLKTMKRKFNKLSKSYVPNNNDNIISTENKIAHYEKKLEQLRTDEEYNEYLQPIKVASCQKYAEKMAQITPVFENINKYILLELENREFEILLTDDWNYKGNFVHTNDLTLLPNE
ncbi:hypothetical protein [Bacillus cereus group sp. TH152-1LC]|uniref:hypothetical protein n=1 Tax=Bacillus cereus group sp. TH152-1LC TaxID=3018060 RepID=UPI0022E76BC3|nr:hypothetical protein [Bacillus cereus group sp. TH152-1LC]MDA1675614.1 hypothetical protein [Bacillus cereus group sp. TH152-1LC]